MKWLNDYRIRMMFVGVVVAVALSSTNAKADFTFGEPINLGPTINTEHYEDNPCMSAHGLELYFNSNRPGGNGSSDLWVSKRPTASDPWQAPVNLGPIVNSQEKDGCPCISSDGLSLFFHSNRPGGSGERDLWVTRRATAEDDWSIPENLGPIVNSSADEHQPRISADGLELFFGSNRSGGSGKQDLWVTRRVTTEDDWSIPENLGPIVNSSVWDYDAYISPDRLVLCFRSDRSPGGCLSGDCDIWVTRRPSVFDPWGPPVYVGSIDRGQGDCGLAFSPDGSTVYFSPDDQSGGFGRYDVWQAPILPVVDFDDDGSVGMNELLEMIAAWGTDNPLCDIGPMPWGDGVVDEADLDVLMGYWGQEITVGKPKLVAHWTFDEAEGTTAHDVVGAYDAELVGDPVWQPDAGITGGALEFDGVGDYVDTTLEMDPGEPFSIFAWVKGGDLNQAIVAESADGGFAYLVADYLTGNLMTMFMHHVDEPLFSQTNIIDGQWHQVGLVWDGSVNDRILFVDGVEVARSSLGRCSEGPAWGVLRIGASFEMKFTGLWSGLIDDVRVYKGALSAEDVLALTQ